MTKKYVLEPNIVFNESVLPFLKQHEIANALQFSINQLLVDENQRDYILHTEKCEIYIIQHENIIYVTRGIGIENG